MENATWGIFYSFESDNSESENELSLELPSYVFEMNLNEQNIWLKSNGKKKRTTYELATCIELVWLENISKSNVLKNKFYLENKDDYITFDNSLSNTAIKYFNKNCIKCNISKFRIKTNYCNKYVEYLINMKINNQKYGKWIRYSKLINININNDMYIETKKKKNILKCTCYFYRLLNIKYLRKKCLYIESFINEFLNESDQLEYFVKKLFDEDLNNFN